MTNVYTSVGCNRTYNCIAWSKKGLVYFGANAAVAVYDPSREKIVNTLVQHTKRVNCVTVVEDGTVSYLVSSSSDGSVCVWRVAEGEHSLLTRFEAHSGSVTCVTGTVLNQQLVLVTTASDSTIKVWKVPLQDSQPKQEEVFTFDLKTGLVLSLHLIVWPEKYLTLFYAGEDCRVNIVRIDLVKGCEWNLLERLRGHDDWVTSVDTVQTQNSLLVASASQDSTIRLWRLGPPNEDKSVDVLEVKNVVIEYPGGRSFSVQLESVLSGHEDKVFSVSWNLSSQLSLLSVSLDKTMIVWREDEGVWMEEARVGEIGGNTLGMLGATWGPAGDILGYSFSGALHAWRPSETGGWCPGVVVGGHQGSVVDIAWDDAGAYLLSTGTDQTTRCHAQCCVAWHEVARPQVHGYDMSCIASLPNLTFVSGAEEKVLRAFKAPTNFFDNFIRLTGESLSDVDKSKLPQGASLPTLGLSNKAVYEGEKQIPEGKRHVKDQFPDSYFTAELLDNPPTEESLVQNTLWPEVHKMYGHGYELFAVASNKAGTMVASACKSSQPKEAAIIVWDTRSWKQIGRIEAHSLTVTQLAFSPAADLLLSVSRDRSWALHALDLDDQDQLSVTRIAFSDKKTSPHKRIIWTCCWSCDGKYFYTGSRDKLVACWGSPSWEPVADPLALPDSVTALAAPRVQSSQYKIAVGLDSGCIHLYSWSTTGFTLLQTLSPELAHHLTVTRLAFSPRDNSLLASSSTDHAVKIYSVSQS